MKEHSFDSLSKEMADATITRGRALKLVGAAILGSTFAGLAPATADAQAKAQSRNRPLVICRRGFFNNNLNHCRNRAGNKRFSCSGNFGFFGFNSIRCKSEGVRYRCSVLGVRFNEVLLRCRKRGRR